MSGGKRAAALAAFVAVAVVAGGGGVGRGGALASTTGAWIDGSGEARHGVVGVQPAPYHFVAYWETGPGRTGGLSPVRPKRCWWPYCTIEAWLNVLNTFGIASGEASIKAMTAGYSPAKLGQVGTGVSPLTPAVTRVVQGAKNGLLVWLTESRGSSISGQYLTVSPCSTAAITLPAFASITYFSAQDATTLSTCTARVAGDFKNSARGDTPSTILVGGHHAGASSVANRVAASAKPRKRRCDVKPWLPNCREHVAPAPTTPTRLPQKPNCRAIPDIKGQVFCVLDENGMSWAHWTADCIITRESRWTPNAISPTSDYGLWQLHVTNLYLLYGGDWWDPVDNTAAAIRLYRLAGYSWSPWTTHSSCGIP